MKTTSCCGSRCGTCSYHGDLCGGCNETGGKPFFTPDTPCPIYRCAVLEKGRESCAGCGEIPCGIWQSTRDPQLSDAQFAQSIRQRMENLVDETANV